MAMSMAGGHFLMLCGPLLSKSSVYIKLSVEDFLLSKSFKEFFSTEFKFFSTCSHGLAVPIGHSF